MRYVTFMFEMHRRKDRRFRGGIWLNNNLLTKKFYASYAYNWKNDAVQISIKRVWLQPSALSVMSRLEEIILSWMLILKVDVTLNENVYRCPQLQLFNHSIFSCQFDYDWAVWGLSWRQNIEMSIVMSPILQWPVDNFLQTQSSFKTTRACMTSKKIVRLRWKNLWR